MILVLIGPDDHEKNNLAKKLREQFVEVDVYDDMTLTTLMEQEHNIQKSVGMRKLVVVTIEGALAGENELSFFGPHGITDISGGLHEVIYFIRRWRQKWCPVFIVRTVHDLDIFSDL